MTAMRKPTLPDAFRDYYRAGQFPKPAEGCLARVHHSPYGCGLFAMVFGHNHRPLALIGPYASTRDMADNLASVGIKLVKGTDGQWFHPADAARGKAMETGTLRKRGTRKPKLEVVK